MYRMKWEMVHDFVLGEKYLIIHKEEFNDIFPWHRKYYGRFQGTYFTVSYGYDYIYNETLKTTKVPFHPSFMIYKMIRTGQANMERRSYEMVMRTLIDGIIVPAYL